MTTETNTPHPHADLLRAIADGRQMQCRWEGQQTYQDISAGPALNSIASGYVRFLRIKPRTRKVVWWTRAWMLDYGAVGVVCRVGEDIRGESGPGRWLTDWQRHEAEVEDDA